VTNLAKLEADADAKRSRLENTLRSLEERATFPGLVDNVIARIGAPTSAEVAEALRRNPLLAAGLALCAGLIAIEVVRARRAKPIRSRSRQTITPAAHRLSPMS
jgi:hypothetical protein